MVPTVPSFFVFQLYNWTIFVQQRNCKKQMYWQLVQFAVIQHLLVPLQTNKSTYLNLSFTICSVSELMKENITPYGLVNLTDTRMWWPYSQGRKFTRRAPFGRGPFPMYIKLIIYYIWFNRKCKLLHILLVQRVCVFCKCLQLNHKHHNLTHLVQIQEINK